MVRLVGWSPTVGTQMPRINAAIQPAPAQVQPAVQNFVPLQNPDEYMRMARAEAGAAEAIGTAVVKGLDVYGQIVEADEISRANAEVARHSKTGSDWVVANTYKTPFRENDGQGGYTYPWEDATARYDTFTQKYKDDVYKRNEFRSTKARAIIETGFTKNDEAYRETTAKFVRDRQIDRGRASIMDEVEEYKQNGNITGIENAFVRGIELGLYSEVEATKATDQALEEMYSIKHTTAILNLRAVARDLTPEQFDAAFADMRLALHLNGSEMAPADYRSALRQLVDLGHDYEDRILDERADVNYASTMNDLAYYLTTDNTHFVNMLLRDLETPEARERFGNNYDKLIEFKRKFRMDGVTTQASRIRLSELRRDVQDGTMGQQDALNEIVQMIDEGLLASKDIAQSITDLGNAPDPIFQQALKDAKEHTGLILLRGREPSMFGPKEREEKAQSIQQYARILDQLRREQRRAWLAGEPVSDLVLFAEKLMIDTMIPEPYWRDASGKQTKSAWEIDEVQSSIAIEQLENEKWKHAKEGSLARQNIPKVVDRKRRDLTGTMSVINSNRHLLEEYSK